MKHFFQYVGAGIADWFRDRRLYLRAWAVAKWQQLRARSTGEK